MADRSYGLIVYCLDNEETYFLLVRHKLGHTSFPKGQPQKGESPQNCALREVKEETSVGNVRLEPNSFHSRYQFNEGDLTVSKQVTFFLARVYLRQTPRPQSNEILEAYWATYHQAMGDLTYPNDKKILESVGKLLKSRGY